MVSIKSENPGVAGKELLRYPQNNSLIQWSDNSLLAILLKIQISESDFFQKSVIFKCNILQDK